MGNPARSIEIFPTLEASLAEDKELTGSIPIDLAVKRSCSSASTNGSPVQVQAHAKPNYPVLERTQ